MRFSRHDVQWGGRRGLNPRPPESQSGALPTELRPPLLLFPFKVWYARQDSNLRPYGLEGRCSIQLSYGRINLTFQSYHLMGNLVGVERFELPTSCSQSRRATRLRYTPILSILPCIRQHVTRNCAY